MYVRGDNTGPIRGASPLVPGVIRAALRFPSGPSELVRYREAFDAVVLAKVLDNGPVRKRGALVR